MLSPLEDRRIFDRFPARFQTKFQYTPHDFGTHVFLKNASAEGLQIKTKEWLKVRTPVTLSIKLPDSDQPLNVEGEVVWTKPNEDESWEAGIKFKKMRLMVIQRLYKFVAPA